MQRVCSAVLLCAVLFCLLYAGARADVEFCPATMGYSAVGSEDGAKGQTFGFELEANSARSVTSRLAFDTDKGWFTATVPRVLLSERDIKYYTPTSSFTHRLWTSPVMYLSFPSEVFIKKAWVRTARSEGDSNGWEAQGVVECQPTGLPRPVGTPPPVSRGSNQLPATHDFAILRAKPGPNAVVLEPTPSAPLEKTDCAAPFKNATVSYMAEPEFPDSPISLVSDTVMTTNMIVALRPDGGLADAWVFGSSGLDKADDEALKAARDSQYRPAIAYCQAVPSFYYFRVSFGRNL